MSELPRCKHIYGIQDFGNGGEELVDDEHITYWRESMEPKNFAYPKGRQLWITEPFKFCPRCGLRLTEEVFATKIRANLKLGLRVIE